MMNCKYVGKDMNFYQIKYINWLRREILALNKI